MTPGDILKDLWQAAGLAADALGFADLQGADPVFPSSFRVGAAAQCTVAAAALAACEIGHQRGSARQRVAVDMTHAAIECTGWFSLDGRVPETWDAFSGLYRCADGHVRLHANFRHHREGALRLLGFDPATARRTDVEQALLGWHARRPAGSGHRCRPAAVPRRGRRKHPLPVQCASLQPGTPKNDN